MTLSDLESLSKILNDTKHRRTVSLRQLSFLFTISYFGFCDDNDADYVMKSTIMNFKNPISKISKEIYI